LEDNFDRFNFCNYKEKEMVAFRRWFIALAVVVLFAGLANAQVLGGTGGTALSCTATVAVPPTLRAEGLTELIGDIVLNCTGGSFSQIPAAGGAIPTVNITVSLGTNVTSRLLSTSVSPNVSDALLLIDEPGSGLTPVVPNWGPQAIQNVCSSATLGAGPGGCVQYVQNVNGVSVQSSSATAAVSPVNVFQGAWTSAASNQVQFLGIPLLPPVSTGYSRIFRVTNIRANVAGIGGAGLAGTVPLNASVSISGSTSIPINNAVLTAGFIQTSLAVSVRNLQNTGTTGGPNLAQCGSESNVTPAVILRYAEDFGTAWKTRVAAGSGPGGTYTAQGSFTSGNLYSQNIPGTIYNSESGFIVNTTPYGTAGLADYGTRLKAVFHNVPSGVSMFVSVNNVTNSSIAIPGSNVTQAQLVSSDTALDTSTIASTTSVAGVPAVSATTTVAGINVAQISVDSTGTATAVWEITATNPAQLETADFVVYQLYSSSSGINSPPIPAGSNSVTATVNMSYGPTPPAGSSSSTLAAWANASGSLTLPRFSDLSTAQNIFTIVLCQTVLLFPFLTNTNGFDTGVAISNTTSDPFGTKTQVGPCALNLYGTAAPVTQPLFMPGTGASGNNIVSGTTSVTLASTLAAGFQGYMIATCNFQLAHGFAFVSDVGARNLAMGYLPLIVTTGTGNRNNITESLAH